MIPSARNARRAFSLVELVIVVVIIGIIGAIAIPRLSRGADGAKDNALRGNLSVLRSAIEFYAAEHEGVYPTAAAINTQLTQYSDIQGNTNAAKTTVFIFGPYMKDIPALTIGAKKGNNVIAAADGPTIGWIYDEVAGTITANTTTEADATGKLYNTY